MLFVECRPDEALARQLGRARRDCLHHNDKGRVCRALERSAVARVGMVDEDPGAAQPGYLRRLTMAAEAHGVRLFIDNARGHRLVVVCPRLEEWLIHTAAERGVAMKEFGLSDRSNDLHREIISKLDRLRALLDRLLELRSPRLLHLQSLIAPP